MWCIYGFIESFIEELGAKYNIREIAFDRWGAVQMIQNLEGGGWSRAEKVTVQKRGIKPCRSKEVNGGGSRRNKPGRAPCPRREQSRSPLRTNSRREK